MVIDRDKMIEKHLQPFCQGIGFHPIFLKSIFSPDIHVVLEGKNGFDSVPIKVEWIEDQQWGMIVDLLSKFWDAHKKSLNIRG